MNNLNKTFLPDNNYKIRNWFIIDCKGQKIGRLATLIVSVLTGKIKPHYYPSVDVGDYIILINADSIIINKNKKHYLVFKPGRPGHSLKIYNSINSIPKLTIEQTIKGMLPKTKRKRLMNRVSIYRDHNHPHQAQDPIKIDISNYLEKTNKINFTQVR